MVLLLRTLFAIGCQLEKCPPTALKSKILDKIKASQTNFLMARTYRNNTYNKCSLRSPRSFNEKRWIDSILSDEEVMEFSVSKLNRIRSRRNIPTHWDDVVTSSHYELDYND